MSKPLIATVITVKATLFAASVAFARGEMPSVILVSALFRLVELGTKSVGQALPRDPIVVSRSDDRSH